MSEEEKSINNTVHTLVSENDPKAFCDSIVNLTKSCSWLYRQLKEVTAECWTKYYLDGTEALDDMSMESYGDYFLSKFYSWVEHIENADFSFLKEDSST
ncbi:MAG: hypothetical protein K2W82_09815 [Candidatus Obscuribacterales bacterium]|nr:hypothetical protein [Candidatus Obscuribacterales bacterium]